MKYLALLLVLSITFAAKSTSCYNPILTEQSSFYKKSRKGQSTISGIGLSIGQECLGAVKGFGYYQVPFGKRNSIYSHPMFSNKSFYFGGEISFFGLFAVWCSIGINAGLNFHHVTLDDSLTAFGIMGEDAKHGYLTYNPKLGIHLKNVWLKCGPSFVISGEPLFNKLLNHNGVNFNLELVFLISEK